MCAFQSSSLAVRAFSSSLFFFLVLVAAQPAMSAVRINEILYDPAGRDDGFEFIELVNDAAVPVSLAGARIEFHNGAGEGWEPLWAGTATDTIGADALFVLGGGLVEPTADVVFPLSLQNGPDAIRLIVSMVVMDVVAYGGLDDPPYSEGGGVLPAPSGSSIGRLPDAFDTDDNADDFTVMTPSPGGWNEARYDVAVSIAHPTRRLDTRDAPFTEIVAIGVVNAGIREVAAEAVVVTLTDSALTTMGTVVLEQRNEFAIAPGGVAILGFDVSVGAGYHLIEVAAHFAPDERSANDRALLVRRAGRVDVLVSEIMSYPHAGCVQFVELYNRGTEPVSLAGFYLRDHAGAPQPLVGDETILSSDQYVVVAPDVETLIRCHPHAPPERVVAFGGSWPSFNRSGSVVSDSVELTDQYGLPVDAVAYPPLDAQYQGRSLERVALYHTPDGASFLVTNDTGGATPGWASARAIVVPPTSSLEIVPNPFAPGRGDVASVSVQPADGVARVVVTVYDLRGRRVADLGTVSAFPAVLLWDGRDGAARLAIPGAYVVACEQFSEDGRRVAVEKAVVGCAP